MAKTKDKLFKCPECTKAVKTKGALTQHMKKEHGGDELAKLRAQFGDVAPRPGGAWKPDAPLQAAPSGVPTVDYAIGIGGVPKGTIIEVFGPPKAGKTFTALTFSSYAQSQGGKAGFVDAENALQTTFLKLVPGLDVDAMEYAPQPPSEKKEKRKPFTGEELLEMSRQFIATNLFDVWTIDSVPALVPAQMLDHGIGDKQAQAALARLMSQGLAVLEHEVAQTSCVVMLINHIRHKPGVQFGRDWYTPGGSALEYYSAVRLHVWSGEPYYDGNRKIGHRVKVKVERSKVAAPGAMAEFDLYYKEGTPKKGDRAGQLVQPGIDMASAWFSILHEENKIRDASGNIFDIDTGERLGNKREVIEALEADDSDLVLKAKKLVYPDAYQAVT